MMMSTTNTGNHNHTASSSLFKQQCSMESLAAAFANMTAGNRMCGIEYSAEYDSLMEVDLEYADEVMEGVEYYEDYGESDMEVDLEYADELMEGVECFEDDDFPMEIDLEYADELMEGVECYNPDDMMDLS